MQISAGELAQLLNGTLEGDPEVEIWDVAKIEAGEPGTVSFLTSSKYLKHAYATRSSVLVLGEDVKLHEPVASPALIRVKHPYVCFAKMLERFNHRHPDQKKGISKEAHIEASASVGKNAYIGAFTYIGEKAEIGDNVKIFPNTYIGDNVKISDRTIIYAGVKIYEDCKIGEQCILHSGVVIGSDGYGYVPNEKGQYEKIAQIGNVVLEDRVEIGANTTIDRGTLGSTYIRAGVKLDNLVQVAHNVDIGEDTVIAAQSGVSGSTKLGKRCMVGGQVGFVGHIQIAEGTKVNAKSGVSKSVKQPGTAINGIPAFNYRDSLKSRALFRKLPDLEERIRTLEDKIKKLNEE